MAATPAEMTIMATASAMAFPFQRASCLEPHELSGWGHNITSRCRPGEGPLPTGSVLCSIHIIHMYSQSVMKSGPSAHDRLGFSLASWSTSSRDSAGNLRHQDRAGDQRLPSGDGPMPGASSDRWPAAPRAGRHPTACGREQPGSFGRLSASEVAVRCVKDEQLLAEGEGFSRSVRLARGLVPRGRRSARGSGRVPYAP